MNKIAFTLIFAVLFAPFICGAQNVEEAVVRLGKDDYAGYIATSKYKTDLVEAAVIAKLTNAGITKHRKRKKFYKYEEVSIPDISPKKVDLYFNVLRKKRKTRIYMAVSKGYDNFITSTNDPATATNIFNFLKQIDAEVAHTLEIQKKEEEVKLMNEKLEKEKANLEKAQKEKTKQEKELEEMKNK